MNIAAFTSTDHPYPEFVSINDRDGKVEISVRSPATGQSGQDCGSQAAMRMSREEFAALLREAGERLEALPT